MNKKFLMIIPIIMIFCIVLVGCKKTVYDVSFYLSDDTLYTVEKVKSGSNVVLPQDPIKEGYKFIKWEYNNKEVNESTKVEGNMKVVAVFERVSFKVTFITNTNQVIEDIQVTKGDLIKEPVLENGESKKFVYWSKDGKRFDFNTLVYEDITLVAIWEDIIHTVTFNIDSEKKYSNVKHDEFLNKPSDPSKDGYVFGGWYLEDKPFDFSMPIKEDISLVAKWIANSYTVSFISNCSSNVDNQIISYNELAHEPSNVINEGYQLLGWYLNDELFDFNTPIKGNITLVAKWTEQICKVKFVTDNYQVISEQNIKYNDLAKRPSTPYKNGYNFIGWYLNNEEFDFNTLIKSDLIIEAKWDKRNYRVRFNTNFDFSIDDQLVKYKETAIIPDLPNRDGYTFLGWYEYGELFDFSMPITTQHSLEAKWEMSKEKTKEVLGMYIESITVEQLYLPNKIDNLDGTITWISSNSDVVSSTGKVTRLTYDVYVKLTAIIEKENETYQLEFETMVEKVSLKPLIKGKIVSGYLYADGGFSGLSSKTIEQLDLINYSFGAINKNGEVYLPNPVAAEKILKYRQNGVRVVLAIGGWQAGGFSEAMIDASSRTKLVNSIMDIIKVYQFDGIDIDWEYPTSSAAGIVSNPNDKNNLTLFCEEMKQRMMEYRTDLILSIAVTISDSFYDYQKLNKYIDIFNVMTYDYAMGKNAYHDSPLYSSNNGSSSMDKAVKFMKSRVDSDKIIPGAAFYCRNGKFSNSQQLGGALSTSMAINAISFAKLKEIMLNDTTFNEQYDVNAGAAYAIYNGSFYSYDNERSIKEKCEYVRDNQLAGLMCWDLSQDYVDSNGTSLLVDVMYKVLKKENI